ncbi:MAG: hypothetical protein U0S12_11840 [Fimbriimonadales bacterium]
MNLEKARENYSAYYEGELKGGLREAFEKALAADAQVQAEYRAFERTMERLPSLQTEVPEPEFDLHDRIMAAIDLQKLETRRAGKVGFPAWWRLALAGGLAVVAVAAILFRGSGAPGMQAGTLPGTVTVRDFKITTNEGRDKAILQAWGDQTRTFVVKDQDGKVQESLRFGQNDRMQKPVQNEFENARWVSITVNDTAAPLYLAIPGTKPHMRVEGSGTLLDLALAASETYRIPVVVAVDRVNDTYQWRLLGVEPQKAVNDVVKERGLSADKRDNVIWITAP